MEDELKAAKARIAELEDLNAGLEIDVKRLREKNATFSAAWDELAALKAQEPAKYEFQADDGSWHPFLSEQHYQNTMADGWPIRALYAAPVVSAEQQRVAAQVEPTHAMILAGEAQWESSGNESPDCAAIYRAMLAAAPAPSTTEGQGDE